MFAAVLLLLTTAAAPPPVDTDAYLAACGITMNGITCGCLARRLPDSAAGRFWMAAQPLAGLPEPERAAATTALGQRLGIAAADVPAMAEAARAAYDAALSDCL